jgi:hypothetical protein
MKPLKLSLYFKIFGLLFFLVPLKAFSQADSILNMAADTTALSKSSRHSLYSGMGYGSNMIYLGSTISGNQPYGLAALTYGYNNELFVTISTVNLSGIKPFFSFYTGSVNYSHVFNSWFDLSASVAGYKFASTMTDSLISNFLYTDLTLGVDWRLIYSKISVGGLISNGGSAYFQIKNSRYFQTPKFINDKVFVSFDPYINILLGTVIESETTTETTILNTQFGRWNPGRQLTTNTSYKSKFGVMEIDFGLPIALNFDRLTVEVEPSYIMPANEVPEFPGPKGFVFLLSGYFKIF